MYTSLHQWILLLNIPYAVICLGKLLSWNPPCICGGNNIPEGTLKNKGTEKRGLVRWIYTNGEVLVVNLGTRVERSWGKVYLRGKFAG